jgi:ferrochelatase
LLLLTIVIIIVTSISQSKQVSNTGKMVVHTQQVLIQYESWATEPAFVDFLAADVRRRLAAMPPNTTTLFTAHSLPARIIAGGDPYPDELNATATAVASAAGLGESSPWAIAWQSAGRTPEPWIGPDILSVIDDLAASEAADGVLVCACGFVADHLEVLYDLDIEAVELGEELGVNVVRAGTAGTHPAFVSMIRELIEERLDVSVEQRALGRYGPSHEVCPANCCLPGTGAPSPWDAA